MKFNFEVKNLGNIKHAELKLGSFSVISGANSSGKSFVTRALYSFFSTINKDHITDESIKSIDRISDLLKFSIYKTHSPSATIELHFQKCYSSNRKIKELILNEHKECSYLEKSTTNIVVEKEIKEFEELLSDFIKETVNIKKYTVLNENLNIVNANLKRLKNNIKNPIDLLIHKFNSGFSEALKENFQVANLIDLHSNTTSLEEPISFNLDKLGRIEILKESIHFNLNGDGITDFQSLYNVVFIESPIYWKLRKPLTLLRDSGSFRIRRLTRGDSNGLSGVPKYFYDLLDLLNQNIKSSSDGNDLFDLQQKIINQLGGELDLSDSGDLMFKDLKTQQNIGINLTATGVTNLGLIALLLKRNVIAKGSFVFIDEPEVNLHPAWQKVMIETLYALSLNGINVVVASHSFDMIKYIENIMDNLTDQEIEEHFAINHLSKNGKSLNQNLSPKQTLMKIKEDLGSPFFEMMLENDW